MTLFNTFLIIGIILLVGELYTGTFYLLVMGISSAIVSLLTIYFANPLISVTIFVVLSLIGYLLVYKYAPKSYKKNNTAAKHIGQIAEVIEISKNNLTILYKTEHWDAVLQSRDTVKIGDTVKIISFSNNILTVKKV